IIAACSKNAITREVPALGSGYLTHLLVSALSDGFKDADRDNDGLLSLNDFIGWCASQTLAFNQHKASEERLEYPELYGEMRGDVFLTVHRVLREDGFNEKLVKGIYKAVEKARALFLKFGRQDSGFVHMQRVASPIQRIAPKLTDLKVL